MFTKWREASSWSERIHTCGCLIEIYGSVTFVWVCVCESVRCFLLVFQQYSAVNIEMNQQKQIHVDYDIYVACLLQKNKQKNNHNNNTLIRYNMWFWSTMHICLFLYVFGKKRLNFAIFLPSISCCLLSYYIINKYPYITHIQMHIKCLFHEIKTVDLPQNWSTSWKAWIRAQWLRIKKRNKSVY